jgi:UDP-N-acetylglucosamine 4-epimerase
VARVRPILRRVFALNQPHPLLAENLNVIIPGLIAAPPIHRDFRAGDVRHSLADISNARTKLGHAPAHSVRQSLREAVNWYGR